MKNRWGVLGVALIFAIICAYASSFRGLFFLDDFRHIVNNPFIRSAWPPGRSMFAAINSARPFVGWTLAWNYAWSGLEVWSYHAVNLTVHVIAALTLFGALGRLFRSPRLAIKFGTRATGLAFAIALLWAVHPLNTSAITYVIQRFQSMAGMFYLLYVYAAFRFFEAAHPRWAVASLVALFLGASSKEDLATAPLTLLAFDALFYSDGFRDALRKRGKFYLACAGVWLWIAYLEAHSLPNPAVGFNHLKLEFWHYPVTQLWAITHYLRLTVLPNALCFDYGWPYVSDPLRVLPQGIFVGTLVGLTVWAFKKRYLLAALGVWFFMVLAVSSSFFPISGPVWEYRMYLALAAPLAAIVLGCDNLFRRLSLPKSVSLALLLLVSGALAWATYERNRVYQSELVLWSDSVAKAPNNPRALNNLGVSYARAGDPTQAERFIQMSIQAASDYPEGNGNYGVLLVNKGEPEKAIPFLQESLRGNPDAIDVRVSLAQALDRTNRPREAYGAYLRALELEPDSAMALFDFANFLYLHGHPADAIPHYEHILRVAPAYPGTAHNLELAKKLKNQIDKNNR